VWKRERGQFASVEFLMMLVENPPVRGILEVRGAGAWWIEREMERETVRR
jgi:hypothetical protein